MSFFRKKVPWSSKPDILVRLNKNHPYRPVAGYMVVGGRAIALDRSEIAAHTNSPSYLIGSNGRVIDLDGATTNQHLEFKHIDLRKPNIPFSMVMCINSNAASNNKDIFSTDHQDNYAGVNVSWANTRHFSYRLGDNAGIGTGNRRSYKTTVQHIYNVYVVGGIAVRAIDDVSLFEVDGTLSTPASSGTATSYAYSNTGSLIGSSTTARTPFDGQVDWVFLFDKELTLGEFQSVKANPWQLLEPANVPIYMHEEVAGVEITPASASLVFSTTAPTISRTDDVEIQPNRAELLFSTTAPTIQVSVGVDQEIQPDKADLVFSTTAPTVAITEAIEIQPGAENLVFSTTAPTLAITEGIEIQPAATDLLFSTTAPSVSTTENIDIQPGTVDLVFSTTSPTVQVEALVGISPDSAQLTFSSTAPSVDLTQNQVIQPDTVNLTFSTTAPTVQLEELVGISPATAELLFSTTAPTISVTQNLEIQPAAADLTFSTTAPTFQILGAIEANPANADLLFSTTAPQVSISGQDIDITVTSGELTFSTTAPAVTYDRTIISETGTLRFSTTAPLVSNSEIIIGHKNLTFSTTPPTVELGELIWFDADPQATLWTDTTDQNTTWV